MSFDGYSVTTRCTYNDLLMHITHLCTSVGVTDAPPKGVMQLPSTSASDFLPEWCRWESRTYRGKVRTDPMLPLGAVSTSLQWQVVRG